MIPWRDVVVGLVETIDERPVSGRSFTMKSERTHHTEVFFSDIHNTGLKFTMIKWCMEG